MRPICARAVSVLAVYLLAGWTPFATRAAVEHADPIPVPRGMAPLPDLTLDPEIRLLQAERQLRDRGFWELPTLATAALELGDGRRALALAPDDPWIRWQVARREHAPLGFVHALALLAQSFPALLWLGTWALASLAGGLGIATLLLVALSLARTLGLHGHAVGHVTWQRDPPSWPGVLLLSSGLGLLAAAGLGPLPWLAIAMLLATIRLPKAETLVGVALIVLSTATLGPPLDLWSELATLPARRPEALAAWRIEREQPLPGDQELLVQALARRPSDDRLRVVTALGWLRVGDLEQVQASLAPFGRRMGGAGKGSTPGAHGLEAADSLSAVLQSRVATLRGSVLLARGEVALATPEFETAARLDESAASLYNLSQVHGRALRLIDQGNRFAAARALDPELLSRYTRALGSTLHRYLIETALPLSSYLEWALTPGPESRALAREVRRRLLGSALPESSWPAIAGIVLFAPFLRRRGIRRCLRCLRPICARCASSAGDPGRTCPRCLSLFSPSSSQDARLRHQQLERDQSRQRVRLRALALLALCLPGSARIFEGRPVPGLLRVLAVGAAGSSIGLARGWSAPPEIGGIALFLPVLVGSTVLVALYLEAALEARNRLLGRGQGA